MLVGYPVCVYWGDQGCLDATAAVPALTALMSGGALIILTCGASLACRRVGRGFLVALADGGRHLRGVRGCNPDLHHPRDHVCRSLAVPRSGVVGIGRVRLDGLAGGSASDPEVLQVEGQSALAPPDSIPRRALVSGAACGAIVVVSPRRSNAKATPGNSKRRRSARGSDLRR